MHQFVSSISSPAQKIKDLVSKGSFQEALSLFKSLHRSSPIQHSSPSIIPSLLKASSSSPSLLPFALQLHSFSLKTNLISHPITLNSLLATYSKHSRVGDARKLFDAMPLKDPVTWNSMINGYAQNGCFSESIEIFVGMNLAGLQAKPELVASVVSSCSQTLNPSLARAIHAHSVVRSIVDQCVMLPTSFIDMYSKCGDLESGLRVFDSIGEKNVVSWTAMINGCVSDQSYALSIDLLRRMGAEGSEANRATMVAVLPALAELRALMLGKEVHGFVLRRGFELESRIIGGLITMYSKCPGAIRLALLIFERAEERDTITWSSMMAATSKIGDGARTFTLFDRMRRDGVEPNSVTMLAVADACIGLGSLDHGLAVFSFVVKSGFFSDVIAGNSLINMFAKCGCLESASKAFCEMMNARDSVSYGTMIQSYGLHGRGHDALRLFEQMQEIGYECDGVALLATLLACNHSGLVEEAKKVFDARLRDSSDGLGEEHYACYVDLLGRNGRIEEAHEVAKKMPTKKSARILSSLVSSCRIHGKFEMAEELARELVNLEPENASNYALISGVHAEARNWQGVEEIRRKMKGRKLRKNWGCSKILVQ